MAEEKEKTTTIQVSEETWKKLNGMKGLGESMNDVITRLLKEHY